MLGYFVSMLHLPRGEWQHSFRLLVRASPLHVRARVSRFTSRPGNSQPLFLFCITQSGGREMKRLIAFIFVFAASILPLAAQSSSLQGVVKDSQNAVVPFAVVSMTNAD